jgi:hypothetical protein
MISIKKMNPHHSPDIRRKCSTRHGQDEALDPVTAGLG